MQECTVKQGLPVRKLQFDCNSAERLLKVTRMDPSSPTQIVSELRWFETQIIAEFQQALEPVIAGFSVFFENTYQLKNGWWKPGMLLIYPRHLQQTLSRIAVKLRLPYR